MNFYRRHRIKKSLKHCYRIFVRKRARLSESALLELKEAFITVQEHLAANDLKEAKASCTHLEGLIKLHFKKSVFDFFSEGIIALVSALVIALIIRQMWFELYEIPTGSMRPTFMEQDKLTVSKTQFGINIPLSTGHFMFDPDLVERGGTITFTGQDMDIRDVDTMYFWIFPGKKQFVKRLIGKPGDSVYFYGGKIYTVNESGVDVSQYLQSERLEHIEHIPYTQYAGKAITPSPPIKGVYTPVILQQFNMPVAKLYVGQLNQIHGEVLYNGSGMVRTSGEGYGELFGYRNFAQTRILTKKQALEAARTQRNELGEAPYYLEIFHNPSFKTAKISRDFLGRTRPMLGISKSYLPLDEMHLKKIFSELYTARFVVEKGYARRYGAPKAQSNTREFYPYLPGIPDGTYEFYDGIAYQVYWQGVRRQLPASHPLTQFNEQRLFILYNIGMEFDNRFLPGHPSQIVLPARYAYFRNHALYLMGAKTFDADDTTLIQFIEKEYDKQSASTQRNPYVAFDDYGPPLLPDGKLNTTFVQTYGLKVPSGQYLVLGDNHAQSGDSREFGFVPEANLRGVPDVIFWPPGSRLGHPNQAPYTLFVMPRMIIWALALIAFVIWQHYHRKKYRFPLKLD